MSGTGDIPGERGFTLIELLVTLALAGLVSGILFPRIEQSLRYFEWRSATDGIAAALARGRADALRTNTAIDFAVGKGGTTYAVSDGSAVTMPSSVRAGVLSASQVTFYRDGTSSGGLVRIAAAGAGLALTLKISPDTGLARAVE